MESYDTFRYNILYENLVLAMILQIDKKAVVHTHNGILLSH